MASTAAAIARETVAPPSGAPAELRGWIRERREALKALYFRRPDPEHTLAGYAQMVDQLLQRLWAGGGVGPDVALIAVGGYGRGALFPHSDVDVLVLLPDARKPDAAIERFIHSLWDVGLEPGHSVRSLDECVEDIDVTNEFWS